jgi:hypothetical protein
MPPADIPDFDSMTPEEVMAWMESLAKRQGAKEGFLTEANMNIAEIDPTTVEIDEPGYVPFGEETSKPAAKAEPAPAPEPPAPEPEPEPVMSLDFSALEQLDEPDEDTSIESGGLAWLESLAADQGSGFPEMDLSALTAELADLPDEPAALQLPDEPAPVTNPLDWLGSLAEGSVEDTQIDFDELEAEEEGLEIEAEEDIDLASITDPLAAGIDPMLWLESLAKRQGAKSEELTTSADMEIPVPEDAAETGPGYAAFSVEDEPRETKAPAARPAETLDPAAWLESMAAGSAAADDEAEMSDDAIQKALAAGQDIAPDQMEKFFERQLERGLSIDEPFLDDEEYDPDAPPIPAELPDWLLEQVQPPDETPQTPAEEHPPVLVEDIVEPPNLDLPDWLQMDESQETDLELESIFESTESVTDEEQAFFSSDPWVQAFTEEAQTDPDEIPEWYERNLRDPQRIAAVEQQMGGSAELEEVELPVESKLPEGEPEEVPGWLGGEAAAEAEVELVPEIPDWLSEADVQVGEGDIPDWLAAADVEVAPDEIPDWLRDTVETEEMPEEDIIPAVPEPAPQQVIIAPAPPAPAPAPAVIPAAAPPPPPVPAGEIAAVLESARSKAGGGDVDGSLIEYERVIRANAALDHVVSDLTTLAEKHKENPAVYRVLGDGLMRQGKLQAALDTYRKALNQL